MIASYSLFEESLRTWNVHNVVDCKVFPLRNTPDHVHICDGDKGGHASYLDTFTKGRTEIEDGMHKSFFYCTNHAAQTVKKTIKGRGEEFNILKKMRSKDEILERSQLPENNKLKA